jgi:hypothetical protein
MAELELENFLNENSKLNNSPSNQLLNNDLKNSKKNIVVINDSDYKNTRQSKINFSTNYLNKL